MVVSGADVRRTLRVATPVLALESNLPYGLTYDDSNLLAHYGWKSESRLGELERRYELLNSGQTPAPHRVKPDDIRRIIAELDECGRWVSVYEGERLVGQAKMALGAKYLSSELFSRNLSTLSDFLPATP